MALPCPYEISDPQSLIQNPKSKIQNPKFFSMSVKVLIPTPLQQLTNNQATVNCDGSTIVELLESLEQNCPGIKARICDDQGQLRRFVNFYVNSEDIRFLEGPQTPLKDGDEVSIIPAIAGG
ncbi:MAG: MoaD/ThiS family protein [Leptolyngbyaceae bacterium]|nr:MoaD/ThiS family protein [Leptolyngbyaceae bacterium]